MMTGTQAVKSYLLALQRGDLDTVGQALAEEVVWHQPGQGSLSGTYHGKQAVFALFGEFMQRSGGSFAIDRVDAVMANGDLVAVPLHFTARRDGDALDMDGVDVFRVDGDGRIAEVWLFSADQDTEDAFWG